MNFGLTKLRHLVKALGRTASYNKDIYDTIKSSSPKCEGTLRNLIIKARRWRFVLESVELTHLESHKERSAEFALSADL